MATLFLHIGHGKTGTSWIQACLRLNRESLAKHGIIYAYGEDWLNDNPNAITSGNAVNLFESKEHFESQLAKNQLKLGEALLFTSESIFKFFTKSNAIDYLEEVAAKYGFDTIQLLFFIRNPIERAVSVMQQRVKRRGVHDISLNNLHEHPEIGWDIIFQVEHLLNRLKKCKNVTLTIRNYSICSDRLIDEVAGWLDLPVDVFSFQPVDHINRSLTWSEHFFQLSLNKILGPSGRFFSDPLCERLPDIIPKKLLPPIEVQESIWLVLRETIERVNLQIPEKHRYQCDIRKPDPIPETLTFSRMQIEVIAESLGNEIVILRNHIENAKKNISTLSDENMALKTRLKNPFNGMSRLALLKQILNYFTKTKSS
jgi:hypothetical protein